MTEHIRIQISPELLADSLVLMQGEIVPITDTMYVPRARTGESPWRPFVKHEWVKSSKQYCGHCSYTIFDYSRVGPEPPEPEPCDCCYCEGDCNEVEDDRPIQRTCLNCKAVEGQVIDAPFYYYRPRTAIDCLCQSVMSDMEQRIMHDEEAAI